MIFGSKLQRSLLMSAIYSCIYATDVQAVVMLKIHLTHNPGLGPSARPTFCPFSTLLWVSSSTLETAWLDQLSYR